MKIAIPTRDENVDDHFGHCEYYTLVDADENNIITNSERYDAPEGCGCKSEVAQILADKGVDVMLAGNMGQGAIAKVTAAGLKVYRGCYGDALEVAQDFLAGKIEDSGETCGHHHGGGGRGQGWGQSSHQGCEG